MFTSVLGSKKLRLTKFLNVYLLLFYLLLFLLFFLFFTADYTNFLLFLCGFLIRLKVVAIWLYVCAAWLPLIFFENYINLRKIQKRLKFLNLKKLRNNSPALNCLDYCLKKRSASINEASLSDLKKSLMYVFQNFWNNS